MVAVSPPTRDTVARTALIHRELVQLGILILVATAAFLLTRTVAASNRATSLHDAGEWYRRGQHAIDSGRIDDGIDAFRHAAVRDRYDKRYVLALARALALKGDNDAARGVLLTLRESAPEDPDINLQLARLAVARHDVSEALRFYHNALYAPWSPDQAGPRRQIRFELVQFLINHEQTGRAQSELLALSTDLPDEVWLHVRVAQLFGKVRDQDHALEQFQRVLRLAPTNREALAGAGLAAFRLGKYSLARTYLRRVSADAEDVSHVREVVDLVLANDPLANRLGSSERRRRLVAVCSYAHRRLESCLSRGSSTDDASSLAVEWSTFSDQLRRPGALEQDTIETGIELIDRSEQLVAQRCGPPTALDEALILMGRQRASEGR